jgi:probable phosphoglycerate mutase
MTTRLILVRHASTDLTGLCYSGRSQAPLNLRGIEEALALRGRIAALPKPDRVLTSPILRAAQTADLVFPGGPNFLEPGLSEASFGAWEGLTHDEAKMKFPQEYQAWGEDWLNNPPPGGESGLDLKLRIQSLIDRLLFHYQGQCVALVSHAGAMRMLLGLLLHGQPEASWRYQFKPACASAVEIIDGYALLTDFNR